MTFNARITLPAEARAGLEHGYGLFLDSMGALLQRL